MKTDSLSTKVYLDIRKKILSSQLPPGTRLKEDVWAKKLEVSRMAVREALNRLHGEKMVISGAKGGYFVTEMTAEDVHEIRELREILELGALRLAHSHYKEEMIKKLEQICEDFTNMVRQGYFNGACEADIKFHETLIEASGNEKLLQVYKSSHIPLFHIKLGKTQVYLEDFNLTDGEHREIVTALKAKDILRAERTLIKHFERGEAAILE